MDWCCWYFWASYAGLSAFLGALSIIVFCLVVPTPPTLTIQAEGIPVKRLFKSTLRNQELLRLDLGIFVLHLVFMALFVVFPVLLIYLGLSEQYEWKFYLPVILLEFLAALPLIRLAEKKRQVRFWAVLLASA